MTQVDDALAKATELTDKQRVKTETALDLFAPKLGAALGVWVEGALAQHLNKRPDLVASIEDDAELSKIKRGFNEVLGNWPDKMKEELLHSEIMSEEPQSRFASGPLGMVYGASNQLIGEAERFVREAFGSDPNLKLVRPKDKDFPQSIQHLVQASWEDFAAEQSKLMELAKQQREWAKKVKEQESAGRWLRA